MQTAKGNVCIIPTFARGNRAKDYSVRRTGQAGFSKVYGNCLINRVLDNRYYT